MASRIGRHAGKAGWARKHWQFLVIAPALAIAFVALLVWEYMWSGEFLSKWVAAVTIISVPGALAAYFGKLGEKDRELRRQAEYEKKMISNNLRWEVRDTLNILKTTDDYWEASFGEKSIKLTNRFFNHDIYDGLVFSGKIGFLSNDLQQKTQNIFRRVKSHNQYLRRIIELQDESSQVPFRHCEILATYEKMLLSEMPQIMRELEAESG